MKSEMFRKYSTSFSNGTQKVFVVSNPAECLVSGALAFVLRISTCAGVAPLRINAAQAGWRISISPMSAIFQKLFMTTLNLTSIVVIPIGVWWTGWGDDSAITVGVWLLDRILIFIIGSLAVYRGPKRMECLINTLKKLQKMNANLNKLDNDRHAKTEKMGILSASFILTLAVAAPGTELYLEAEDYAKEGSRWWKLVMYPIYYIANIMGLLALMQFSFTVLLVHRITASLNQRLQRCNFVHPSQVPSTIRHLALTYCHTEEMMRRMLQCDGVIIMILLVATLLHLVVTPYFLLLSLSTGENPLVVVLEQLGWSLLHIGTVLLLVEPCHYVQTARNTTKYLLGQLMVSPRNKQISRELDQFAKQVALNSSGFMPLGVVTLGRPITATMFGSVATYLVIIMQFHALSQH